MSFNKWEEWAGQALKGRRLHEPPEHVLRAAEALGSRLNGVRQAETTPVRTAAWPRWMRGLAAASILGVAVIGTLLLREAPPPLPDRGFESTVRGTRVELLSPAGDTVEAPRLFVWSRFDGATSYRVRILAVDDEVLWESVVADESVALPEQMRDRLQPAVVYRWRVEASDADGVVIGRSETSRFRIKP